MKLNRYQAFGCHLGGSVLVALFCSALVFFVWYPAPLAEASGVTQIFMIMLAVDVVIGPLITLLVFNPSKKELKFDLAIVLLLQVAALLYGLHTVFVARPVYLVFCADKFNLVYANDLLPENVAKASAAYKTLPIWGPKIVAAKKATDPNMRAEMMISILKSNEELWLLPQYYVAYDDEKTNVLQQLKTIEKLRNLNNMAAQDIDALIKKYSALKSGISYVPLKAKVKNLAVIVNSDTSEVLDISNLKPW